MIVQCQCGQKNQVPAHAKPGAQYRCGNCKTELHIVWEDVGSIDSRNGKQVEAELSVGSSLGRHVSKIPAVISGIFLLLAVFARWPYGFYTLLRFAVCGSAIYLALQANDFKKPAWVWIMGAMAVLFNPLVPVRFPRSVWQITDFIAAAVFATSLAMIRKKSG